MIKYNSICLNSSQSGTLNLSGTQLPSPDEEHKPPD